MIIALAQYQYQNPSLHVAINLLCIDWCIWLQRSADEIKSDRLKSLYRWYRNSIQNKQMKLEVKNRLDQRQTDGSNEVRSTNHGNKGIVYISPFLVVTPGFTGVYECSSTIAGVHYNSAYVSPVWPPIKRPHESVMLYWLNALCFKDTFLKFNSAMVWGLVTLYV